MKYQPVLPEDNHNVSDKHPLKELLQLLAGLVLLLVALYWMMGFLVDWAVDSISPETEASIYKTFNLNGMTHPLSEDIDKPTEEKLQKLMAGMGGCANIAYPVKLQLQQSDVPNAVAFPGGDVVVFSPVPESMETENGMAFVLAHELAHFKNRDHLRMMGRGIVLVAISALIGDANAGVARIWSPIQHFENAQYSQDAESKADETALEILNCHYGHIGGATEFFEVLKRRGEEMDFELMHYFSSHPQLTERIERIGRLGKEKGYRSAETVAW